MLDILRVPDPRLRQTAAVVRVFDIELENLAVAMLTTMYEARGCGLAAPQVGVGIRLVVLNYGPMACGKLTQRVMVNPRVAWTSAKTTAMREGCLSCPDALVFVTRPNIVDVEWDSINDPHAPVQKERFRGWAARIVQHEIDHLDGKVIADG